MKVYIGSCKEDKIINDIIISFIKRQGYEVIDFSIEENDIYNLVLKGAKITKNIEDFRLIFIDKYGIAPFMIASKFKHLIVAQLEDDFSAKISRNHNNANTITLGKLVLGIEALEKIILTFLRSEYFGGKNQVRVNMLHKLLAKEIN